MNEWKPVGVVVEGQRIDVAGIDPWNHRWILLSEPPVELPHPSYPDQRHRMLVYEIEIRGQRIEFAAGELSPNVWAFHVPA